MASSSCATQPPITWPSVTGVASIRCVRPIMTTSTNARDFASSVARSARAAGSRSRVELLDGRDVHDSRKRVVRRLPAIHVVVGVNGLFRADDATRELDRAVGDHLVGVHVRLRAGTGLEHDQRKLGVELAVDHFLRRALDQCRLVAIELAERRVGARRAFLQQTERADHRPAPLEAAHTDREIVDRALRLRAPQVLCGDAHFAERVLLDAE